MKLHIVMVALNNAQMTSDAIKSIQSPIPFYIHLMDQESTEQFTIQVDDYKRFSPRVPLSKAWNEGIKRALEDEECEYILIPNNDVLFHADTIKNLIYGIDNLDYAMVTGENVAPRYSVDVFHMLEKPGDLKFDCRPITNWREEGPDFSCFMIKRDFVSKFGFFDENFTPAYCEDQDMHVRIIKGGSHAKRLTTAPYYHFGSQTLAHNHTIAPEVSNGHMRNQQYYRKKWGNEHGEVLDNNGYQTPFNEDKPIWYWGGCEFYDKYYAR